MEEAGFANLSNYPTSRKLRWGGERQSTKPGGVVSRFISTYKRVVMLTKPRPMVKTEVPFDFGCTTQVDIDIIFFFVSIFGIVSLLFSDIMTEYYRRYLWNYKFLFQSLVSSSSGREGLASFDRSTLIGCPSTHLWLLRTTVHWVPKMRERQDNLYLRLTVPCGETARIISPEMDLGRLWRNDENDLDSSSQSLLIFQFLSRTVQLLWLSKLPFVQHNLAGASRNE